MKRTNYVLQTELVKVNAGAAVRLSVNTIYKFLLLCAFGVAEHNFELSR